MGHYKFHIPKNSVKKIKDRVMELHPRAWREWQIRYWFVIDYIIRGENHFRTDVPVNRNHLSEIISVAKKHTSLMLKDIEKMGIIKKTKAAKKEISSSRYSIADKSEVILSIPIDVRSSKVVAAIINKRNTRIKNQDSYDQTEDGKLYGSFLEKLKLNSSLILNILSKEYFSDILLPYSIPYRRELENSPEPRKMLLADHINGDQLIDIVEFRKEFENLVRIHQKDIYVKRPDPLSRVYTPFSVMNRAHRKYVTYEGKTLKAVDISNSQPLLSGAFMRDFCKREGLKEPQGLNEYIASCEQGKFYEQFMEGEERLPQNRSAFKEAFFGSVFFTRVSKRKNVLKSRFISKYPEVHKLLDAIKTKYTHKGFAVEMQRFEAKIMHDKVTMGLLRDGYDCYNIYDSIVSYSDAILEEAQKRIKKEFQVYGITPHMKIEDFSEDK